jgi:transcriptional regulator of arginine metabolism
MKEREARLEAIRDVLDHESVDSQHSLAERLRERGFAVTQATLSRDLKNLGVAKRPRADGRYVYSLQRERSSPPEALEVFLVGFARMEFSGQLGVIHTLAGHAPSVAAVLDDMQLTPILGTVAGDDTILVVLREDAERGVLRRELIERFPQLGERIAEHGETAI